MGHIQCLGFKLVNCGIVVRRDSGPCHSGGQTRCSTKVIQSSVSTHQLEGQGTLAWGVTGQFKHSLTTAAHTGDCSVTDASTATKTHVYSLIRQAQWNDSRRVGYIPTCPYILPAISFPAWRVWKLLFQMQRKSENRKPDAHIKYCGHIMCFHNKQFQKFS